jgi:hypothetical protein
MALAPASRFPKALYSSVETSSLSTDNKRDYTSMAMTLLFGQGATFVA